jgi:hypothetical protein
LAKLLAPPRLSTLCMGTIMDYPARMNVFEFK